MHSQDRGICFSLLAGGDYAQLVDYAFRPEKSFSSRDVPWIIGGLTLLGHSEEASGLYESWAAQLSPQLRIASRFFLGVCSCREGRYESARGLFLANLKEADRKARQDDLFFAYQGRAFLRYQSGRLWPAKVWADAAVKIAGGSRFIYGSVLSLELRGHIQLSLGLVQSGFRTLQSACERAQILGQGALLQAMDVSVVLYRSTFGICLQSEELIQVLEDSLKACLYEDSYTRASLILALARLRLLQGKLNIAKQLLTMASELVYQIDNHGLEINYNLLLANLLRQQGETLQALSLVRGARHRAETHPDLKSNLRASGLEAQLLKELGRLQDCNALAAKIEKLTRTSGSLISQRILQRGKPIAQLDIRPGADPLGDLIDQSRNFPEAAIPAILQSGWLTLLIPVLGVKNYDKVLYFDVQPGTLTLFNCGEITHRKEGCSGTSRKLIMLLARGEISKEMIAIQLWGKAYSPLRDDSLIYSLVAKTRRLLESVGDWIEVCEVGYRLRSGVRVMSRNLQAENSWNIEEKTAHRAPLADEHLWSSLNARQLTVLNWVRAGECIEAKSMVDRLQVSDATASRDLSGLLGLGLVKRLGKGRATRYVCSTSQTE